MTGVDPSEIDFEVADNNNVSKPPQDEEYDSEGEYDDEDEEAEEEFEDARGDDP